jgi:excisionase family DNA binding protein
MATETPTAETYLTAREVAATLRLHTATIYQMIADGRLHAIKVGWQHRISRSEVDRLLPGAGIARRAEAQHQG